MILSRRLARRLTGACAVALLAPLAGCVSIQTPTWLDFHHVPAPAPAAAQPGEGDQAPGYLTQQTSPAGLVILPPPPAAGSAQAVADRSIYETLRAMDGSPRWKQATRDADLGNEETFRSFSCAGGVRLSKETTPTLWKMWPKLLMDTRTISEPPKNKYMRTRPMIGDDKPICTAREDWMKTNGSYPSGHSLAGWSLALTLAEADPGHATQYLKRGYEFGYSRVICGVHFASDVEAGRTLAGAMIAALHADPAYEADLNAARAEIARARASGATPQRCEDLTL